MANTQSVARLAKVFRDECDIYSPLLVFSFYSFLEAFKKKKNLCVCFLDLHWHKFHSFKRMALWKKRLNPQTEQKKKSTFHLMLTK